MEDSLTNLEKILIQRGIKQKKIAEICGVSEPTVSYWLAMKSRRGIPHEARLIIASFLDIDPDEILNEVDLKQCA